MPKAEQKPYVLELHRETPEVLTVIVWARSPDDVSRYMAKIYEAIGGNAGYDDLWIALPPVEHCSHVLQGEAEDPDGTWPELKLTRKGKVKLYDPPQVELRPGVAMQGLLVEAARDTRALIDLLRRAATALGSSKELQPVELGELLDDIRRAADGFERRLSRFQDSIKDNSESCD